MIAWLTVLGLYGLGVWALTFAFVLGLAVPRVSRMLAQVLVAMSLRNLRASCRVISVASRRPCCLANSVSHRW